MGSRYVWEKFDYKETAVVSEGYVDQYYALTGRDDHKKTVELYYSPRYTYDLGTNCAHLDSPMGREIPLDDWEESILFTIPAGHYFALSPSVILDLTPESYLYDGYLHKTVLYAEADTPTNRMNYSNRIYLRFNATSPATVKMLYKGGEKSFVGKVSAVSSTAYPQDGIQ